MAKVYGQRWETVSDLPAGGQGFIYVVQDKTNQIKNQCILKRLINPGRIERFKDEIKAAQMLDHVHIARMLDFNLEHDPPYIVTEYYKGGDLETAKPFWRDSPVKALELFQQICLGVAHAHAQGIVHRDLKPANILLHTPNGPAVVGDFGLCFLQDDGTRVTLTEEQVGSRYYMAPELADGRAGRIDKRCDTYSLGKILYWLLSGRIFDREKHRKREWDLRGSRDLPYYPKWNNVYLEHVNRLLDKMIQENVDDRLYVDSVCALLPRLTEYMRRKYNPISHKSMDDQQCYYCGYGYYRLQPDGTASNYFGIAPVAGFDWRFLICDTCGHVQMFRVDKANELGKGWWSTDE